MVYDGEPLFFPSAMDIYDYDMIHGPYKIIIKFSLLYSFITVLQYVHPRHAWQWFPQYGLQENRDRLLKIVSLTKR